jgi:CHAT domain
MASLEMPDPAEIEEYTAELTAELAATEPGHPERGRLLYELGLCESARYAMSGSRARLDAGVSHLQAALTVLPRADRNYPEALISLSSALTERFTRFGDRTDEQAALDAAQAAAQATAKDGQPTDPEMRILSLGNLGTVFQGRYERTGKPADLNEAIGQYRAALDVAADGPGTQPVYANLSGVLRIRFEQSRDPADLDAAIQYGQAAVAANPPGTVYHAPSLSNLSSALIRRFQRGGALRDADDAISALRAALRSLPPDSPDYAGMQGNLAQALLNRYRRTEAAADLDEAVAAGQLAQGHGPRADPRYGAMMLSAAAALRERFVRDGDPADLDAAIELARLSAGRIGKRHANRIAPLTLLTALMRDRYEYTGDPVDLDAAIRVAVLTVRSVPKKHLWRANALVNLAILVRTRYQRSGRQRDRIAAQQWFIDATKAARTWPSVRLTAFFNAGELASDPRYAADALGLAVRLLGVVAPRGLSRHDRQFAMGRLSGIASAAAAAALANPAVPAADRPAQALALLEAGRGVLLSQALETRDDLTDLRHAHPELAGRFIALRDQLDQEMDVVALAAGQLTADEGDVPGRTAEERDQTATALAETLAEIRALPDFATFGLPPTLDELRAEAAGGPVVTLMVTGSGGGALLLTRDGVSYLPLPGLDDRTVTERVTAFHAALALANSDDGTAAEAETADRTVTATLEWLWDTAAGPVLDALGYRTRPADGAWPRVWWIPGGLLGLLPVHAAGYHQEPASGGEPAPSVLDRVVSSYTPTIRTLRYARQQAREAPGALGAGRALVVAMPVTPGQRPLPGVAKEVATARRMLPDPVVLAEPAALAEDGESGETTDNLPTRANVLRCLPACTVAHFACHAESDPADPSRSRLVLRDDESGPLTVAALAPVYPGDLELTYLSACSTTLTATSNLADEAIHLTSAFLLAGSRHVVGTLWAANDVIAPKIAAAFYAGLRDTDNLLDTARAARALHEAVRAVRAGRPHAPALWATYLHAGA